MKYVITFLVAISSFFFLVSGAIAENTCLAQRDNIPANPWVAEGDANNTMLAIYVNNQTKQPVTYTGHEILTGSIVNTSIKAYKTLSPGSTIKPGQKKFLILIQSTLGDPTVVVTFRGTKPYFHYTATLKQNYSTYGHHGKLTILKEKRRGPVVPEIMSKEGFKGTNTSYPAGQRCFTGGYFYITLVD